MGLAATVAGNAGRQQRDGSSGRSVDAPGGLRQQVAIERRSIGPGFRRLQEMSVGRHFTLRYGMKLFPGSLPEHQVLPLIDRDSAPKIGQPEVHSSIAAVR